MSSIDLFARVNAIYSTFFGTSPPARACVAIDLPQPIQVRLDCIAFSDQTLAARQALHVQGLSYWAPANIGPYSQAITVSCSIYEYNILLILCSSSQTDERIFISGQIGLLPSQLTLPSPPSLGLETALASQHVSRITRALKTNSGGGWDGQTQGILYWLADRNDLDLIKAAHVDLNVCCSYPLILIRHIVTTTQGNPNTNSFPDGEVITKGCSSGKTSPPPHWSVHDYRRIRW